VVGFAWSIFLLREPTGRSLFPFPLTLVDSRSNSRFSSADERNDPELPSKRCVNSRLHYFPPTDPTSPQGVGGLFFHRNSVGVPLSFLLCGLLIPDENFPSFFFPSRWVSQL